MKVALVYDRINKWGGAERVLQALHELFPEADLYTSVYSRDKAKWAKKITIHPSFLQNFPYAKKAHEFYALLMPVVFESFSFDDYDLVISVTSEAGKGIITKPHTLHICYCLTPTRYLWSGYSEYFNSILSRALSSPAIRYLKNWDKVASMRPDLFIAISHEVQRRIKTYYQRDSVIIHPPVSLIEPKYMEKVNHVKKDYYLVVSRLVHYKRIDLAILACNKLGLSLKIVGVGSEMEKLKKISGPNIQFLGFVRDDELKKLYLGAKALLFPGAEDFGIVMVEALGFGTPVIAYKKGGALDIIEEGKFGVFFSHQTVSSVVKGIKKAETINFSSKKLREHALYFSATNFKKRVTRYIDKALQKR